MGGHTIGTAVESRVIKRVIGSANRLWRRPPAAEITASFVNASAIQRFNRVYRHVDRPTTTLSFIYQGSGRPADPWIGEMFFCRSLIKQRARAAGQTYSEALAELAAHSVLHILGYDHRTDAQERAMERLAQRITKRAE